MPCLHFHPTKPTYLQVSVSLTHLFHSASSSLFSYNLFCFQTEKCFAFFSMHSITWITREQTGAPMCSQEKQMALRPLEGSKGHFGPTWFTELADQIFISINGFEVRQNDRNQRWLEEDVSTLGVKFSWSNRIWLLAFRCKHFNSLNLSKILSLNYKQR